MRPFDKNRPMLNICDNKKIILASESPRRRELLERAGLPFQIIPSHIDENGLSGLKPEDLAETLASKKAGAVAKRYPDDWVIGADTVVVIGDQILGKPRSEQHARTMLEKLNGKKHRVITGFSLQNAGNKIEKRKSVITNVFFKDLSQEEICWYIQTGEPFGKAGAYAIQGSAGGMVKRIEGSYSNVVGLPVCELMETLLSEGVISYS